MQGEYRMKGGDGREYGPAGLDEMRQWISQDRVNAETHVSKDNGEWIPAGHLPELGFAAASAQPAAGVPASSAALELLGSIVARIQSSGSWFFWVAALSAINSAAAFGGSDWRFVLGLGITQIIDAIGSDAEAGGKIIVLVLDSLVILFLVGCGIFARKGHAWVFLLGMLLFLLDTGVFVLAEDWLGLAFHVYLIFAMFRGFQACRELKAVVAAIPPHAH